MVECLDILIKTRRKLQKNFGIGDKFYSFISFFRSCPYYWAEVMFPGVTRAVLDFLSARDLPLHLGPDSFWWTQVDAWDVDRGLPKICENLKEFECEAVQRYGNLVDLEKSWKMTIYLQRLASIQPRTSPPKFGPASCPLPRPLPHSFNYVWDCWTGSRLNMPRVSRSTRLSSWLSGTFADFPSFKKTAAPIFNDLISYGVITESSKL